MLREGLLVGVRSALQRVRKDNLPVRIEGMRVRSDGGWRRVDVRVIPLKGRGTGANASFVIAFEEPSAAVAARTRELHDEALAASQRAAVGDSEPDDEAARIKQELAATRHYLQSVIEQQEAANEELQSANEEVQSANEELQSINEELETSKEEIQSSNEELATVNDELQNRNLELSQSNNDLTNLLASVQLAIVMLGADLRIRRFTPSAEKLFNLVAGDVGRPLPNLQFDIDGDELETLLRRVIETVQPHEREIQDRSGRWYSMRLRPYRTLENRIEGVVVVVVDINDQKVSEKALRDSERGSSCLRTMRRSSSGSVIATAISSSIGRSSNSSARARTRSAAPTSPRTPTRMIAPRSPMPIGTPKGSATRFRSARGSVAPPGTIGGPRPSAYPASRIVARSPDSSAARSTSRT
jgi:two-component system CheB/CheR fusion protein